MIEGRRRLEVAKTTAERHPIGSEGMRLQSVMERFLVKVNLVFHGNGRRRRHLGTGMPT